MSVHFGARPVGTFQCDGHPARVFRLTPEAEDIRLLETVLDRYAALGPAERAVPEKPGIDRHNHHELAVEAFEKSLALLQAQRDGKLHEGPIVLVALDEANRLMAISLGHIERHLEADKGKDGQRVYSPLPWGPGADKARSSLNWLVSLGPARGVAKVLTAVHETLLPSSVRQVDVVSELPNYTPGAIRLYQGFGGRQYPAKRHEKPIPMTPTPKANLPTFDDMHGMPMRASRKDFARHAQAVREAARFMPAEETAAVDLSQTARIPTYPA